MGLSLTHMIFIAVVLLLFFGPGRLPGLGKSMGEAIRGFKKGLNDEEDPQRDVTSSAKTESLKDSDNEKKDS